MRIGDKKMKTINIPLHINDSKFTSSIDVFLKENPSIENKPLPTVIICPGGGYDFIASRESEPVALAFMSQGFQAIVLNYTVMQDGFKENFLHHNLLQVAKIFEIIHQNSKDWQIDLNNIFVLGFSAGGHLAASYSSSWSDFKDQNKQVNYKPKGTILCYPVTNFELGWPKNRNQFDFPISDTKEYDAIDKINSSTTDTFIWHTADDATVPVINTLKYCEGLSKCQIGFEAHIYESGRHGLSLATRASAKLLDSDNIVPNVAKWFPTCIDWINRRLT